MAGPTVQTREEALAVLQAIGHKWAANPDQHSDDALVLAANNALNPSASAFNPSARGALRAVRGEAEPKPYVPPLAGKGLGFLQNLPGARTGGLTGALTRQVSRFLPEGGAPSDLKPEVFDVTEALSLLTNIGTVQLANLTTFQTKNPAERIIAAANAELNSPIPAKQKAARDALLAVRSGAASGLDLTTTPPAAAPFKYATLGGTQGYSASDPFGVLGPSAAPSAAGPMDIQSEIDSLTAEYNNLVSQPDFQGDPAAAQQSRDILERIFDLRDAQRKTTGAGGVSADTAAQIASQREARAQAQAQFEAQMAFDRQNAVQRIREAQSTTLQNLMTAKQNAAQADAQFMTQNRQSIFPMGTKYAPGLEPGGAFGQLMSQLSGKPYQGEAINPQPINLRAQQDQIQSDVAALLEQMKSWGIGG